jgi:hypothetical protein
MLFTSVASALVYMFLILKERGFVFLSVSMFMRLLIRLIIIIIIILLN